jgi:signal transduction histidine kinase
VGALPGLRLAAGAVVGTALFAAWDVLVGFPTAASDAVALSTLLTGAVVVAALLTSVASFLRWRLAGDAVAGRLSAALAIYALPHVGLAWLLPVVSAPQSSTAVLASLRPAGCVVLAALLLAVVRSTDVDTRMRPARVLVRAVSAIAVATVALQLLPGLRVASGELHIGFGLAAAWMAIGLFGLRGLRAPGAALGVRPWLPLLLVGLGGGELLGMVATSNGGVHSGPALLQLTAVLCALAGVTGSLQHAYRRQARTLHEASTTAAVAMAEVQAVQASQEERAHEARNALTAIEGATRTLQRYRAAMEPAAVAMLSDAVSAEIHRLQELISPIVVPRVAGRFRLAEAIAAVVTCERSLGARITVDVPEHLVAHGHPTDTAQVVQNLIENARRHGGGDVTLRAALIGEQVELRVEDRGPGIPADERERVFTRGFRGRSSAAVEGSGLGLHVSARLMAEQGGALRAAARPGGGASMVLTLSGFSESSAAGLGVVGEQPVDRVEEPLEARTGRSLRLVPFSPALNDGDVAGVVEDDQPVSHRIAR